MREIIWRTADIVFLIMLIILVIGNYKVFNRLKDEFDKGWVSLAIVAMLAVIATLIFKLIVNAY